MRTAISVHVLLKFERPESELKKEKVNVNEDGTRFHARNERIKSKIDADLDLLEKEKNVVTAKVELRTCEDTSNESDRSSAQMQREHVDSSERTKQQVCIPLNSWQCGIF